MPALTGNLTQLAPADPRRHDLDALRAFAMLLGIVLHAALSFMDLPWVVHDQSRAPALGLLVAAIHGFRMPLFFLLSGFFTAMLWRKRGLRSLLRNRAKRIVLPLLLGCLTIVPAMWAVTGWAGSRETTANAVPDTTTDIWTAAAYGDLEAIRMHVERGASLDAEEPIYGQSPLAWAVIGGQQDVVDYLLDAGANASARYRDQNTALHTAAFFGRAEAASRLLETGADVNARNVYGETPLDSMRHGRETTSYIAGILNVPIDFDAVVAGRERIRATIESQGAVSGLADPGTAESEEQGVFAQTAERLLFGEFFFHLWFLWFLCWFVAGFALIAHVSRRLSRVPIPRALIATPLCLLWLVPLTALTQSFMHSGGTIPGFGADTSSGLAPTPHVLAYHAVFFGFGALLYAHSGASARFGRGWHIQLSLASGLFLLVLGLAANIPWGNELAGGEGPRHLFASLGQALYTWLMVFGLMGLCEKILNRERPWVRYVSDSSYWLYLVHLPLIIAGQALLRDVTLPALMKLLLLVVTTSAALLASYQLLVRHTRIGRLLNGPNVGQAVSPTAGVWPHRLWREL